MGDRLAYVPVRVRRERTKGWTTPLCGCGCGRPARYVGRGTPYGNPFVIGTRSGLVREPAIHHPGQPWEYEGRISTPGMRHDYHHGDGRVTEVHVRAMTLEESLLCFERRATGSGEWPLDYAPRAAMDLEPLRGHDLSCWCRLDSPCHADVLLRLANISVPVATEVN